MSFEGRILDLIRHLKKYDISDVSLKTDSEFGMELQNWVVESTTKGAIIYGAYPSPIVQKTIHYAGINFRLI
jgi:hypothetical protein